ncbi:hypothetical protein F4775DRAFT_259980 [Biscogniauxia sp. FL1348]|nr:hypothetical protein F4775DRAFT_259980 [Biscogniauxia sp. FL1348]
MEPHGAPPPPYTEIDTLSHSLSVGSPAGESDIRGDDASSIAASSSPSNIIYTPPDSPRGSQHTLSGGGGDDYRHTTPSAQAYFDSRPALRRTPSGSLIISVGINENATADDFPYPTWAGERETTEQDWQTFVNHLLPDHAAKTNSHIIDRKLRNESEAHAPETKRDIAEAQLDRFRSSSDTSDDSRDVDATIREWNDGFFSLRGITIRRLPLPTAAQVPDARTGAREQRPLPRETQMPGAWHDAEERGPPPIEAQPQSGAREPGANQARWNPFSFIDRNGIQIGPLRIDGDRVAFGNTLVVDRRGVRWNGQNSEGPAFEANSRGMRWRNPTFPGQTEPTGFNNHQGHEGGRGDPSDSESSITSSSSDSASSIGSLPDWDDLKDNQLPVMKQSITSWLAHPEQPVTKDMVKRAKASIKAAKTSPSVGRASPSADKQALRQEIRGLVQQFNQLKKQQKASARAARKERREQRKALRHERRTRRHAERREHRSQRRRFRRGENEEQSPNQLHRGHGNPRAFVDMPGSFFTGFGAVHNSPNIPGVPSVPPPPPPPPPPFYHPPTFPPGPSGFFGPGRSGGPGFFGGRGGMFGHRGRRGGGCSGRGPFGWEQHVQQATQQAAQAVARSQEQASRAIATSMRQAAEAQEQAMRQAAEAREQAMRQVAAATQNVGTMFSHNSNGNNNLAAATAGPSQPPQLQRQELPGYLTESTESKRTIRPLQPQKQEQSDPSAHESKYATVDRLEEQLSHDLESLWALQEKILLEKNRGSSSNDDKKTAATTTTTDAEAQAAKLEKEIQGINAEINRLRLEADEEFAMRLMEEEVEGGGRRV